MKVVPVTVGPIRANGVPSLNSCASTVNRKISDPSTAECNSTVQVSVTSDPTITVESPSLFVSVTVDGIGTKVKKSG